MKKVGQYVGRVHGRDMRSLVISNVEKVFTKPTYPTGDTANDEKKAVWNKEYDQYMKKMDIYEEQKAQVFVVIIGRCTMAMSNRIEKLGNYEDLEKDHDVVGLLKVIKQQIFDANEKKYICVRSVVNWKQLMRCKQNDNEDLIDYYHRFCRLIEAVELSYGNIKPKGNSEKKDRHKFIAYLFVDGADKAQYGKLLKDMETDYSLDKANVYPDSIESALQVLILYSEKRLKYEQRKKKKGKDKSFVQAGKACWECGSEKHQRKDCPKYKARKAKESEEEKSGDDSDF